MAQGTSKWAFPTSQERETVSIPTASTVRPPPPLCPPDTPLTPTIIRLLFFPLYAPYFRGENDFQDFPETRPRGPDFHEFRSEGVAFPPRNGRNRGSSLTRQRLHVLFFRRGSNNTLDVLNRLNAKFTQVMFPVTIFIKTSAQLSYYFFFLSFFVN